MATTVTAVGVEKRSAARRMRAEGLTYGEIADRLGTTTTTAYRWAHPSVEIAVLRRGGYEIPHRTRMDEHGRRLPDRPAA